MRLPSISCLGKRIVTQLLAVNLTIVYARKDVMSSGLIDLY